MLSNPFSSIFASTSWILFGDHPIKIKPTQRRLAWPLRKDDTHKSRSVPIFLPYRKVSDVECGYDCDDAWVKNCDVKCWCDCDNGSGHDCDVKCVCDCDDVSGHDCDVQCGCGCDDASGHNCDVKCVCVWLRWSWLWCSMWVWLWWCLWS